MDTALASQPLFVSQIHVEQLFGQYTYDLHSQEADLSKLLILYGDNGSGKTTMLNCLFHMLSPAADKGHRGALGRIPFQRFSVSLGPDTAVTAERPPGNLIGTFDMTISRGAATVSRQFEFDPAFKLLAPKLTPAQRPFMATLRSLDLKIHLLSDDRKIVTDLAESEESDESPGDYTTFLRHSLATKVAHRAEVSSLEQAIRRALDWIRKQAITGSGAGEINANTLYTDITQRIVSPFQQHGPAQDKPQLTNLIADLDDQAKRSVAFAKFGLASELPADELIRALKTSRAQEHAELLDQILRPFVEGFRLRLDALELIQKAINTFVDTINDFYQGKSVSFHLREGLAITSTGGGRLTPNMLSSGEKQMLLLLCNVLGAGDDASIFIIDEPELSLNVKWQRKFVDALLACTQNAHTQIILATHSIELLTQHANNVLQLKTTPVSHD
jgi:energy-coupling factor transporter ATP-binding protein EcfA2